MTRILTIIVLLVGVFFAPWWVVAIALVVSAYAHPRFIEGIAIALIGDILFGAHPLFGIPGGLTFVAALSIIIFFISERFLRNYVLQP
ncbi:MAG: hypothetical protein AAB460_03420 [Patescibacteria group bacterium]